MNRRGCLRGSSPVPPGAGRELLLVDPYQIGLENPEAIGSGAFWFYRKLGFRPVQPEVLALAEREERRMRKTPGYRSSRRTLRGSPQPISSTKDRRPKRATGTISRSAMWAGRERAPDDRIS